MHKLKDFKEETELDRKLLMGVFDTRENVKKQLRNSSPKSMDLTQTSSNITPLSTPEKPFHLPNISQNQ